MFVLVAARSGEMYSGEGSVLPHPEIDGIGSENRNVDLLNCDDSRFVEVDYVEKCPKGRYVRVCFYFVFCLFADISLMFMYI